MTRNSPTSRAILNLGLLASIVAFIFVLINIDELPSSIAVVVLFAIALATTAIGVIREARKEESLDEVELAGASFGARWGIVAVILVALMMTFIAPLQGAIVNFSTLATNSEAAAMPAPAKVFILGLVTALAIQLIAKATLSTFWKWSKR